MSAEIFSMKERESAWTVPRILGRDAEVKHFSETWLRAREERYFARIAGIESVREDADGEIMLEVRYVASNVTNDAFWFSNPDLTFVANVSGRWMRFEVSRHSGWTDRMAIVMLKPATHRSDECPFADYPTNAILVESNGHRALFSKNGRLPLAP